jgi:hypothetical protein
MVSYPEDAYTTAELHQLRSGQVNSCLVILMNSLALLDSDVSVICRAFHQLFIEMYFIARVNFLLNRVLFQVNLLIS